MKYIKGNDTNSRLVAIDPADCGCTECLIGEYMPLDSAINDPYTIADLLTGKLGDNTNDNEYKVAVDTADYELYEYDDYGAIIVVFESDYKKLKFKTYADIDSINGMADLKGMVLIPVIDYDE